MSSMLEDIVLLYSYIGVRYPTTIRDGRRALLLLSEEGLLAISEVVARKGGYKSTIRIDFKVFKGLEISINDFLTFSTRPYHHVKIGSLDLLLGINPLPPFRVRTSSKNNINVALHGVKGAIKLSQTQLSLDRDSIGFLKEELNLELNKELAKYRGTYDVSVSDVTSSNMRWWKVIMETKEEINDWKEEILEDKKRGVDLAGLKVELKKKNMELEELLDGLSASSGYSLTTQKVRRLIGSRKTTLVGSTILKKIGGEAEERIEILLSKIDSLSKQLKDSEDSFKSFDSG